VQQPLATVATAVAVARAVITAPALAMSTVQALVASTAVAAAALTALAPMVPAAQCASSGAQTAPSHRLTLLTFNHDRTR